MRSLGKLQVVGKREAVATYELLGTTDDQDVTRNDYARRFGQAVELFQQRRWTEARDAFAHCAAVATTDAAVELYLSRIDALEKNPPPADWNQAIELTSK